MNSGELLPFFPFFQEIFKKFLEDSLKKRSMQKLWGYCHRSQIFLRILMRWGSTWRLLLINSVTLIKPGITSQVIAHKNTREMDSNISGIFLLWEFFFLLCWRHNNKDINFANRKLFSHLIEAMNKILFLLKRRPGRLRARRKSVWKFRHQFSDPERPETEPESQPQCGRSQTRGPLEDPGDCSWLASWTTGFRHHS